MTYSALVSTPSSSVSSETPRHDVSSFDHFVTQWMSTVIRSLGSAVNCSQVHDLGVSISPLISKLHRSIGWWGVGPADSTGKSCVRYWPGGTRPAADASPRRPRNPREIGGGNRPRFPQTRQRGRGGRRRRPLAP